MVGAAHIKEATLHGTLDSTAAPTGKAAPVEVGVGEGSPVTRAGPVDGHVQQLAAEVQRGRRVPVDDRAAGLGHLPHSSSTCINACKPGKVEVCISP